MKSCCMRLIQQRLTRLIQQRRIRCALALDWSARSYLHLADGCQFCMPSSNPPCTPSTAASRCSRLWSSDGQTRLIARLAASPVSSSRRHRARIKRPFAFEWMAEKSKASPSTETFRSSYLSACNDRAGSSTAGGGSGRSHLSRASSCVRHLNCTMTFSMRWQRAAWPTRWRVVTQCWASMCGTGTAVGLLKWLDPGGAATRSRHIWLPYEG